MMPPLLSVAMAQVKALTARTRQMMPTTLLAILLFSLSAFAQDDSENPLPFNERYRPQFHYTTVRGWTNDPIGLVYYKGEYHIFNDHNPFSCRFPGGKTDGQNFKFSIFLPLKLGLIGFVLFEPEGGFIFIILC